MRFYQMILVSSLLFIVGCGQKVVPVSGRVTLDGKPLANAMVIFHPLSDEPNPGPGSKGNTDADGRYHLQLLTDDTQGAILGKHSVRITAYEGGGGIPSSGSDMVFQKRIVPDEYNAKSSLTFEVTAGGSTNADFALKSTPE